MQHVTWPRNGGCMNFIVKRVEVMGSPPFQNWAVKSHGSIHSKPFQNLENHFLTI